MALIWTKHDPDSESLMASVLEVRKDCRCTKGGGWNHSVWRIRSHLGRNTHGNQVWGRSRTHHGSKHEANRLANQTEEQKRNGNAPAPYKMTVGEYLKKWWHDEIVPTRRLKTQVDYGRVIDRLLFPNIATVPLRDFSRQHVIDLRNQLLARPALRSGRPPARQTEYAIQVLRSGLTNAAETGLIASYVASRIQVRNDRPSRTGQYDRDVIRDILGAVSTTAIGPIVYFILETGVRRGEALALRWADVDVEKRWIEIHRSVQRIRDTVSYFARPSRIGAYAPYGSVRRWRRCCRKWPTGRWRIADSWAMPTRITTSYFSGPMGDRLTRMLLQESFGGFSTAKNYHI